MTPEQRQGILLDGALVQFCLVESEARKVMEKRLSEHDGILLEHSRSIGRLQGQFDVIIALSLAQVSALAAIDVSPGNRGDQFPCLYPAPIVQYGRV